jgi:tubulin polyglutamylase TTLL6/13
MQERISMMGGQNPTSDFDVCWVDGNVPPEALAKLKQYQRISQYPGIAVVANKNKLARSLMKMRKQYPSDYNFFPQTYLLPVEYNEFKA